jgi:hypothetical protein
MINLEHLEHLGTPWNTIQQKGVLTEPIGRVGGTPGTPWNT